MKLKTHLLVLVFGIFIIGCGLSTDIVGVWRSPENAMTRYQNICIAAMTEKVSNKQIVEQEMNVKLINKGIKSSKMTDLFPYKFTGQQAEKDLILEKVRENGNDAILTFALIKHKEETRYVPGSSSYSPYHGYGTYGGYYGYYGARVYDPGYYTQDEVYFIESNLYDVKTEKLVWSCQSKTYNPSDIVQFSKDFTLAITNQLIKSKVIVPVTTK
jgi:hypothetical protein